MYELESYNLHLGARRFCDRDASPGQALILRLIRAVVNLGCVTDEAEGYLIVDLRLRTHWTPSAR